MSGEVAQEVSGEYFDRALVYVAARLKHAALRSKRTVFWRSHECENEAAEGYGYRCYRVDPSHDNGWCNVCLQGETIHLEYRQAAREAGNAFRRLQRVAP